MLDVDRREEDANLGLFHVDPAFKAPSGIGLRLDVGIVKGGGYLYADPVNDEYAGALELQFGKWSVKAIGVLSQRPDGGWSLLLLVYAQFPPMPARVRLHAERARRPRSACSTASTSRRSAPG